MDSFDEKCKELIVFSDIIYKQNYRRGFVEHFLIKLKELNHSCLNDINVKILQRLQSALSKPLLLHLRSLSNSTDECLIIQCLTEIVKLTLIHNSAEFFEIFTSIFFKIFKGANSFHQKSEEIKMSVLECACLMIQNSSPDVLKNIYSEKSCAKFSLGISISVDLVKTERSIKLRIAALDFLLAASKFEPDPKYNIGIYIDAGNMFAQFLPGITAPLLEVILGNETQHHQITVKALRCWGHIICLTMSDFPQEETVAENEIIKQWLDNNGETIESTLNMDKALKEKNRSANWRKAAAIALHPIILKVADIRKHSNSQCRLELVKVMIKCLQNCLVNLNKSLPSIIDVLVCSTVEEDDEVCRAAQQALGDFEKELGKKSVEHFVSVMEENLYCSLNKLKRTVHVEDEKAILISLKTLVGYLQILGRLNRLHQLIRLSSTLRKLIFVLQMVSELETYPDLSNQNFSLLDTEKDSNIWVKSWKRFRFFTDKSTELQLIEVCRVLGQYAPPDAIFDFLIDSYTQETKKEILLILNEVIIGCDEIPVHVVRQLLDFYLSPKILHLTVEVDETNCVNLREAQCNIIKIALLMEGFGKIAKILGMRFQNYLLDSLYYVLEGMGNRYAVVRDAATTSAVTIANVCGFGDDIGLLIQNNADYLTYHLTVKLKRSEPGVFDVITVLIKNSSFEIMLNFDEIIHSVLKTSGQNFDSPYTISYLRLFQTFVLCVNKWTMVPHAKVLNDLSDPNILNLIDTFIIDFKKLQGEPKEEEVEEESESEDLPEMPDLPETFPEETEKIQLPKHLKTTLLVANHCLHFLASKDKNKKLIVLEILNECAWALADWEDELLPLVHKIWSPLVTRFEQITDPLLINRSFALLCTLCHTSRNFIRFRTLKNVLPILQSFLIKEACKSKLQNSASGYFFTQNFKLQRDLLENLGPITSSLELFEKQTDLIIESALPYLSSFQPRELQERSKKLFFHVKIYDPYLIWLKLDELRKNPEYEANAKEIFKSFE